MYTVHFNPTDRRKSIDIPILQDNNAESDETFTLELNITSKATIYGVVALSPASTEITIIDDDSKD